MREQLRKEIVKRTGEYVQSAAAAAAYEEESAKIAAEYDRLVAEGKTELEAYRAMLDDIEAMKLLLAAIPPSEKIREEQAKKEKRLNRKFLWFPPLLPRQSAPRRSRRESLKRRLRKRRKSPPQRK